MLPVPCRPATCHVSMVLYSRTRHQEETPIGRSALAMDHAAEEGPVAILAAAGIAPVTAEAEAAIDRGRLAGRHRGRADQHRGVAAPHLLRRAVVEDSQEPGDHAEHAVGPAGRHVTFAERDLDVIECAEIHLVAAPALGLQHAKETRRMHLGDSLRQDAAALLFVERTLGKRRDHCMRARNQLRRLGRDCSNALGPFHVSRA